MTLTSSTLLNVGSKCGCACNPVEHQPEQCSPVRYKGRFGRHWDTPLTGGSASGGGEGWEREQGEEWEREQGEEWEREQGEEWEREQGEEWEREQEEEWERQQGKEGRRGGPLAQLCQI